MTTAAKTNMTSLQQGERLPEVIILANLLLARKVLSQYHKIGAIEKVDDWRNLTPRSMHHHVN